MKEYQSLLQNLSQISKDQGQCLVTDQPDESGLASIMNGKFTNTSTINEIVNFLAFLFEKGYECSSVNYHRSVTSAHHAHVNNNSFGQHPRVCALMTSIFNTCLPKLRYTFVWDTEKVLKHLNDLHDDLDLSIKLYSYKLTMLLSNSIKEFWDISS